MGVSILQPYQGVFVSADSASTRIDLDAIMAGCNAVENEASNIDEISNSLSNTASSLTPDVFSVDGYTATTSVDECCNGFMEIQAWIFNTISQIRENAINAYNNLQTQLNNDAQIRDVNMINAQNSGR